MKRSVLSIIRESLAKSRPVENADLTGKTVVVVGANTGIGLQATIHFARMNAGRIILACRSEARGGAAIASKFVHYSSQI
jgi:retinol dehydrogenase-12